MLQTNTSAKGTNAFCTSDKCFSAGDERFEVPTGHGYSEAPTVQVMRRLPKGQWRWKFSMGQCDNRSARGEVYCRENLRGSMSGSACGAGDVHSSRGAVDLESARVTVDVESGPVDVQVPKEQWMGQWMRKIFQ